MREYGQVQCAFWQSRDAANLSDRGRLLALYLLTGPHSNGIGCYSLPDGYLMADLGWDEPVKAAAVAELEASGLAMWCRETRYVLIPKFLKWNGIANPKIGAARLREARAVPSSFAHMQSLREAIAAHAGEHFPHASMAWPVTRDARNGCLPTAHRSHLLAGDPECCRCGSRVDLTIDHVFPEAIGGTHDLANLRVMCRKCNSKRPVAGDALITDLALDGVSISDFYRFCPSGKPSPYGIETVSKQEKTREEPNQTRPDHLSVPNGTDTSELRPDPEADEPAKVKQNHCPIAAIVDLYHECLPDLPRCEKVTDARAGYIRQRWKEDLTDLDHWRNFFGFVAQSPFLMGRSKGRDGKPPFVASLEWLTKPANFAKISEGNYHR